MGDTLNNTTSQETQNNKNSTPPSREHATSSQNPTTPSRNPADTTQTTTTQPSNMSMAKSSLIMFAGTFVSRILGLIRSALLLATLGVSISHDAFNIANTLPNTIFNLLAGGVLNAILVPQIVRAFRKKNGDEFVNRLITTAGLILLTITVIATIASSLLVSLYAYELPAGWKNLTVAFAFWCMPQIFFYGLYVLYGQVLNAKYSFGPYMWAPVVNNIISIIGLAAFIWLFGLSSPETNTLEFWSIDKIILIAGTGTLGVICQALILIPIIKRTGFKLKLVWGIRGHGMRHASTMALWAFGVVVLSQIELLLVSNLASAAQEYALEKNVFIPAITVYTFAYLIYIIPQSLVTTSIITALFTRLSNQAASGEDEKMASDYMFTSTILGTITIFSSIGMIILALPLTTLVGPARSPHELSAIATVLSVMCICIPFQGLITINTRVLFAYEKTKNAFFIEIPRVIILTIGAVCIPQLLHPKYWIVAFCAVRCFAFVFVTITQSLVLKHSFSSIRYKYLVVTYVKQYFVMFVAGLTGWVVRNYVLGDLLSVESGSTRFFYALVHVFIIGLVMLSVYVLGLMLMRISELKQCVDVVKTRVLRK